jgi:D-alanyl-D-alanine carboxypeptidase
VLAGQVAEAATGEPLPAVVREELDFEGLGLDHTFFLSLEPDPDPDGQRLANVFGEVDLRTLDPSTDLYGGGGLVSTGEDVATFYRALFQGEVLHDPASLDRMTTVSPQSGDEQGAMGIYLVESDGIPCYGHIGFYGTEAVHCPSVDLTIVRSTGQALYPDGWSFDHLDDLIAHALT